MHGHRTFRPRTIDINKPLSITSEEINDTGSFLTEEDLGLIDANSIIENDDIAVQFSTLSQPSSQLSTSAVAAGASSFDLSSFTAVKRFEIPIPVIQEIELTGFRPNFVHPSVHIRYRDRSLEEEAQRVEYDLDSSDEAFLDTLNTMIARTDTSNANPNNKKITPTNTTATVSPCTTPLFPAAAENKNVCHRKVLDSELELILDRIEKVMGFSQEFYTYGTIEPLLLRISPKHIRSAVLKAIYDYWTKKRRSRITPRSKKLYQNCGVPLLQQFEIPPDMEDPDPFVAFRPREKEKTVRKKKNDEESYRKLRALRTELERVRTLMEVVLKRERLKKDVGLIQYENLNARLQEVADTETDERPTKRQRSEGPALNGKVRSSRQNERYDGSEMGRLRGFNQLETFDTLDHNEPEDEDDKSSEASESSSSASDVGEASDSDIDVSRPSLVNGEDTVAAVESPLDGDAPRGDPFFEPQDEQQEFRGPKINLSLLWDFIHSSTLSPAPTTHDASAHHQTNGLTADHGATITTPSTTTLPIFSFRIRLKSNLADSLASSSSSSSTECNTKEATIVQQPPHPTALNGGGSRKESSLQKAAPRKPQHFQNVRFGRGGRLIIDRRSCPTRPTSPFHNNNTDCEQDGHCEME